VDGIGVDPVDLHVLGVSFTDVASDTAEAFAKHHRDLADFSVNLFGTTRAALTAKVGSWRETAGALTDRAHGHGMDLHANATGYQQVDRDNRDRFGDVADAGGSLW
jgi:hypothetical protein